MDLGIAGRTAIVCASSKGLGRACAVELAHAGCRVAINGRDADYGWTPWGGVELTLYFAKGLGG